MKYDGNGMVPIYAHTYIGDVSNASPSLKLGCIQVGQTHQVVMIYR